VDQKLPALPPDDFGADSDDDDDNEDNKDNKDASSSREVISIDMDDEKDKPSLPPAAAGTPSTTDSKDIANGHHDNDTKRINGDGHTNGNGNGDLSSPVIAATTAVPAPKKEKKIRTLVDWKCPDCLANIVMRQPPASHLLSCSLH
jgi:hypothetical protein